MKQIKHLTFERLNAADPLKSANRDVWMHGWRMLRLRWQLILFICLWFPFLLPLWYTGVTFSPCAVSLRRENSLEPVLKLDGAFEGKHTKHTFFFPLINAAHVVEDLSSKSTLGNFNKKHKHWSGWKDLYCAIWRQQTSAQIVHQKKVSLWRQNSSRIFTKRDLSFSNEIHSWSENYFCSLCPSSFP